MAEAKTFGRFLIFPRHGQNCQGKEVAFLPETVIAVEAEENHAVLYLVSGPKLFVHMNADDVLALIQKYLKDRAEEMQRAMNMPNIIGAAAPLGFPPKH